MLTDEQKETIERAGTAFCKPSEAAKLAGIDFDTFKQALQDEESDIYAAYYSGLENSKLEVKESIITIAKQGSSPAQTLAIGMLKDINLEMEEA